VTGVGAGFGLLGGGDVLVGGGVVFVGGGVVFVDGGVVFVEGGAVLVDGGVLEPELEEDGAAFFGFFLTAFSAGRLCADTLAEIAADGTWITLPTLAAAAFALPPPPPLPALAPTKAMANTATTMPAVIMIWRDFILAPQLFTS
jgi:hypothetical protein